MYTSQITFTLDIICPWTYLAKKRLALALAQLPEDVTSKVTFPPIKINPYRLYPQEQQQQLLPSQKISSHQEDADKSSTYEKIMGNRGAEEGISFKNHGPIADTLNAHRVIWYFQQQQEEEEGSSTPTGIGSKLVDVLYRLFFEEGQNPSSAETLLAACLEVGIPEAEARRVVEDESEGVIEVKSAIRETVMNGLDSVPTIMFEGRRRDLTLTGAKEVQAYVKAMETIAKEST